MSLENGKTAAYVRDGALVVEFGGSSQPFIWRYDLTKVHGVLFKVVSDTGAWQLGVESAKGDFTVVSTFASETKAKAALSAIAEALRAQEGEKRAYGRAANALMALIILAALVLAIAAWPVVSAMVYRSVASNGVGHGDITQTVVARPTPGQAISADQALQPPAP